MAFWKQLSIRAATSAAAFLAVGTIGRAPALAAPFKFSFTSDEANGYIVFDNSVPALSTNPGVAAYIGGTEYKIDLGDQGVFQGTNGTSIIFLGRAETGTTSPNNEFDALELEVRGPERQPQTKNTLLGYFFYPKGTFNESTELPTTVPSTATARIFPNADFPNNIGETAFQGTVQTRIEAVPEPASLSAVFGVGAWLILRRRQLRQVLPNAEMITPELLQPTQNKQTVS